MNLYYRGYTVPETIRESEDMSCDNSYCSHIDCVDCILYPSIVVRDILHDYLMEINKDEYISTSIEGLPSSDNDGRS